jgi:hypothetical protein
MFDYVKNKYNQCPDMVAHNDLNKDYLYVEYTKAPYLMLPKTLENFRSLHKKKFWYKLRRYEKLFQKDFNELTFSIVKDQKELSFFLDQVFILFNKRWNKEYTSCTWKHKEGFDKYKKAMIDLCSSNEAFLAVLFDKNKKLLSYGYCLDQDNTIYFYQHTTITDSEYRKYSLGKVLLHNLLKHAVENKYDKFDFMAGDASYKYEWTRNVRTIYISVGRKKISNYFRMYLLKSRYFFQFNYYSRKILKLIFKYMEVLFGKG